MKFKSNHPHYEYLRKKWLGRHKSVSEKLLSSHGETLKQVTLGGLGGLMLLTNPTVSPLLPTHHLDVSAEGITKIEDQNALLAGELQKQLPKEVRKLTAEEDNSIGAILSEKFQMPVKAEIDGIKLNRSYGLIGGEQHLYRYPGDTLVNHADNASDWAMYGPAGIAPGLGAWGYFVPNQSQFSDQAKERERYYLAVQTFLAPGFAENFAKYRDFFRFRKMLVVNPKTGQAVVAVIGDAGPAEWTGKHLGGSPEVMEAVGLAGGPRKGPVLYFFIDDPNDKIPLGPVSTKGVNSI